MSTTRPQPWANPPELRVGVYRLLTKIGEGGMGVVHLAQAPDGRRLALKVLRPHVIGDDEARERLAREVSSLRRVRSPRVAEILDADPWGHTPYVATRYVPGLSLHEHVRREGTLRGEDLRWFAAGLAEAVIAVHSVGVLHRDIKPSNVLLEGRSPVLIDFGLARVAEDSRLTHTGWLLGTPGYLAPEILYGDDATTASDVHSWAATVAFAATGQAPFGRGPAMAVMDRVRRGEHDLSAVPPQLRPLLEACLAPDPADRPETAAVLASLRAPAPAARPTHEDFTMPFAVVGGTEAPTEARTEARTEAPTVVRPAAPVPGPTRHLTAHAPGPPREVPTEDPPGPGPRQPSPVSRFQRTCLALGLLALVALGFTAAPYLLLAVVAPAALLVRTLSWTTESASARQWRRGRRRWYDGPLTLLSSPWYLLVATAGTVLLLAWAGCLAVLTAVAYLVFGLPLLPGLGLVGAVLGLALWWGPGARRVRSPTRQLLGRLTRWSPLGWLGLAGVATGCVFLAYQVNVHGVSWAPEPGAPWRPGTVLGDLIGFL